MTMRLPRFVEHWRERWRQRGSAVPPPGDDPLQRTADSLRALLDDPAVPAEVRESLAAEYAELQALLDKLEHGRIQIAAFGRVSVGKSALLNALLGHAAFEVGVLHGTTRQRESASWQEVRSGSVHLIDTPGINELGGEQREALARAVAARSDLLLFVIDGDIGSAEFAALQELIALQRPLLLVLNKADRYTPRERDELRATLLQRCHGLVEPERLIFASAQPRPERVLQVRADGSEIEIERPRAPDVAALRAKLIAILDAEGKTLAALNAALFAGDFADQVGRRLTELRQSLGQRITRSYCLAKGLAVGLNPIPVADLVAAAGLDVALVMHLSRIYGLPMGRAEAGQLLATIAAQLAALAASFAGIHLIASALKAGSAGLSTAVTAAAQGAVAWYATLLVARAAERYLAAGKSWGEQGPKRVVKDIVASLDRDSILREAREEILARLRRGAA